MIDWYFVELLIIIKLFYMMKDKRFWFMFDYICKYFAYVKLNLNQKCYSKN